jgi:hypothetical protein
MYADGLAAVAVSLRGGDLGDLTEEQIHLFLLGPLLARRPRRRRRRRRHHPAHHLQIKKPAESKTRGEVKSDRIATTWRESGEAGGSGVGIGSRG